MRQIIFYIAIALLAFGIGSFIAVKFYYQSVEKQPVKPIKEKPKVAEFKTNPNFVFDLNAKSFKQQDKENAEKKVPFTCKNKTLVPAWNYLRKNEEDAKLLDDQIEANGFKSCSEIISILEQVDLNNDGIKEVIVGGKTYSNFKRKITKLRKIKRTATAIFLQKFTLLVVHPGKVITNFWMENIKNLIAISLNTPL